MGRPKVECRLDLSLVETLQPGNENQHAIGGDKGGLAEHREEDAVIEHVVAAEPEKMGDPVPEQHRRDANDDAGHEDRRGDDGVMRAFLRRKIWVRRSAPASEHQRQDHHEDADDGGELQPFENAQIIGKPVEPFEGEAFPWQHLREARGVEGGDRHDDQRAEQEAEEQQEIGENREPGEELHLPISPSFTLKMRIIRRTNRVHTTSRMTA